MESERTRDNRGCKYEPRRPLLCLRKTVEVQSKEERKIVQNKKQVVLQTEVTATIRNQEGRFFLSQ